MPSFEGIAPAVKHSGGRLQPTQLGAALIRGASVYFPDDSDVVLAKINRFGLASRCFKQCVHTLLPG
jgi:hypothetical protein